MPATLASPPPARLPPAAPAAGGDFPFFRLSGEQYDEMARLGVLDENDRVELIDGLLYAKMATNPPHDSTSSAMVLTLNAMSTGGWFARGQSTLALPDGRPEPDVAVLPGKPFDYARRHPDVSDALLVVEVSDSTLDFDRATKLKTYARAGIVEYWIVNVIDRQIEVHTQPDLAGPEPRYASRVVHAVDATIALPAALGGAAIAVAALLPPA